MKSSNRTANRWDKIWLVTGIVLSLSLLAMAAPRHAEHSEILASTQPPVSETRPDQSLRTHQSLRNIEDIEVGQTVLARDPATGQLAPREVAHVIHRLSDHLRILEIRAADGSETQTIKTTDEHPFWVTGKGWQKAGLLQPGDELEQSDGAAAAVIATHYEPHPEGIAVYNIEVDGFHTYYVAAHGTRAPPIWVHNKKLSDAIRRFAKEELGAAGDLKSLRKYRETAKRTAKKRPVVLGENMRDRVIPTAKEIDGHVYRPRDGYTLEKNKSWAREMKRQVDRGERELVDIGPDPRRRVRSEAYLEERKIFYPEEGN